MKLRPFTTRQLADRLMSRPAEYAIEIEPAIVRKDGRQFIDIEHPAYISAMKKYGQTRLHHVHRMMPDTRIKGVGDHLHDIIVEQFGKQPDRDCGCRDMIARMNAWGPDGCSEHRGEIIDTLMEGKARLSIWLRAVISVAAPLARSVCGDMLDEAIRRCEKR